MKDRIHSMVHLPTMNNEKLMEYTKALAEYIETDKPTDPWYTYRMEDAQKELNRRGLTY